MPEKIVLAESFGGHVALGAPGQWRYDDDYIPEVLESFLAEFEQVRAPHGEFLGNPDEDFYQGHTYTTVYRRKSDGKLFGISYWQGGGKYGEPYYESEEIEEDVYGYVLREVEPFYRLGYVVKKDA